MCVSCLPELELEEFKLGWHCTTSSLSAPFLDIDIFFFFPAVTCAPHTLLAFPSLNFSGATTSGSGAPGGLSSLVVPWSGTD
jgi:hypothetical protein